MSRKGSKKNSRKGSKKSSKKGSKKGSKSSRPSPTESATLFKEGTTKVGNDGNTWIIAINKNGVKQWKKDKEDLSGIVFDHLYKWWQKVSSGSIIVIYTNGEYKTITSKMKTRTAQIKDMEKIWKGLAEDDNVKAIITSAMSTDALTFFSDLVVKKINNKKLKDLMKKDKLRDYLIENYNKFFLGDGYYTDKDIGF